HGADRCGDNRADNAAAEIHAEPRKQPAGDHRADDADDDIADKTETEPAHDLAREPAGDRTNDQQNDKRLGVHGALPILLAAKPAVPVERAAVSPDNAGSIAQSFSPDSAKAGLSKGEIEPITACFSPKRYGEE